MFVSRCCGVFAVFLELVDRFVSCVAICQRATTVLVGLFYRGLTKEFGLVTSCGTAMFGVKPIFVFGVVKRTRRCAEHIDACRVAHVGYRRVVTEARPTRPRRDLGRAHAHADAPVSIHRRRAHVQVAAACGFPPGVRARR